MLKHTFKYLLLHIFYEVLSLVYFKYINFKCNIEYHFTVLYYNNTLIKYFACTVVSFNTSTHFFKAQLWFDIITYFIYIIYTLSVHYV